MPFKVKLQNAVQTQIRPANPWPPCRSHTASLQIADCICSFLTLSTCKLHIIATLKYSCKLLLEVSKGLCHMHVVLVLGYDMDLVNGHKILVVSILFLL